MDAPEPTFFDPPDVNAATDRSPHVARNRLHQRRQDAEAVLATWPAPRRQAYTALAEAVGHDAPRAALQDLLIDGGLAEDVLAALQALVAGPVADGVDRDRLLAELARELAEPAAINQHAFATCGVTALQMLMAREHPAEYVRLVAGLASPAGHVRLRGGAPLGREPGTETAGRLRRDRGGGKADGRALPARLFQSAAMELANGDLDYDATTDEHVTVGGHVLGRGMTQDRLGDLLGQLVGHPVTSVELCAPDDAARGALLDHVAASAAAGHPVPVGLDWNQRDAAGQLHERHELLVTAVDAERVYFLNPWGRAESMPRVDFAGRLFAASLVQPRAAGTRIPLGLAIAAALAAAGFGLFNTFLAGP